MINIESMTAFINGYIECACKCFDGVAIEKDYSPEDARKTRQDLSPEALTQMEVEAADFFISMPSMNELQAMLAGHDYWRSRSGTSLGFTSRVEGFYPGWAFPEMLHAAALQDGPREWKRNKAGRIEITPSLAEVNAVTMLRFESQVVPGKTYPGGVAVTEKIADGSIRQIRFHMQSYVVGMYLVAYDSHSTGPVFQGGDHDNKKCVRNMVKDLKAAVKRPALVRFSGVTPVKKTDEKPAPPAL